MIEDVKRRSRYINYIVIGVMVIAYICALLAYSILVLVNDWAKDNEKTHLGFTNSLIIGFTDTILICWGTFSVRGIYLSPFHSSVALGITRVVICFSPTYWILIDASVFCILLLVFITCWIWKNIEVETVKSKRQKMQKNIYESVSKTEHLREYLIKEKLVTDAGLDAAHRKEFKIEWWHMLLDAIPSIVLFCVYLAFCFSVTHINMSDKRRPDITVENTYEQSDFSWMVSALVISYTLFALWFRLW